MLDLLSISLLYAGFALAHAPSSRSLRRVMTTFPRHVRSIFRITALGCICWGFVEWPSPMGPIPAFCAATAAFLALGSVYALLEPLFPKTLWATGVASLGAAVVLKLVGRLA